MTKKDEITEETKTEETEEKTVKKSVLKDIYDATFGGGNQLVIPFRALKGNSVIKFGQAIHKKYTIEVFADSTIKIINQTTKEASITAKKETHGIAIINY